MRAQWLKENWALVVILFLAAALRAAALLKYGDFWGDELFSVTYSRQPLFESLRYWVWETNPPLYFIVLKIWFWLLPVAEWSARLPSFIFGLLSVAALYLFANRRFGRAVANLSALLLALSSYQVFISVTARAYALLILLTILSAHFFFQIFVEHQNTRRAKILFALVNLALLYAHFTGVVVLLAQAVFLLAKDRSQLGDYIKINLAPGLIWCVWLIPSLYSKLNAETLGGAWFLIIIPSGRAIINAITPLFTGGGPWYLVLAAALFFLRAVGQELTRERRTGAVDENFLALLFFIFIPVAGAFLMRLFNIKFFLVAHPFVVVVWACWLAKHARQVWLKGAVVLLLVFFGLYELWYILPLNNWRTVTDYLDSRATRNSILLYNNFVDTAQLNYYYHGGVPIVPFYLGDRAQWDKNIITQNYLRLTKTEAQVNAWLKAQRLERFDRVFILQGDTLDNTDLAGPLEKLDWRRAEAPVAPRLLGHYQLFNYIRDEKKP